MIAACSHFATADTALTLVETWLSSCIAINRWVLTVCVWGRLMTFHHWRTQQRSSQAHVQHDGREYQQSSGESKLIDTQSHQRWNRKITNTTASYWQTISKCPSPIKVLTNCNNAWRVGQSWTNTCNTHHVHSLSPTANVHCDSKKVCLSIMQNNYNRFYYFITVKISIAENTYKESVS